MSDPADDRIGLDSAGIIGREKARLSQDAKKYGEQGSKTYGAPEQVTADMISEISVTSEGRIKRLKEEYAGDNCPASPLDIADAILRKHRNGV